MNVWNIASVQSQQQLFNQTQSITELLMKQVEHEAHYWVEQQETDKLQQLVEYVTDQPHVLSAVIRDRFGEDIVTAGEATSIIDWPTASLEADPWILVEEINEEQNISGYLTRARYVSWCFHYAGLQPNTRPILAEIGVTLGII
jgi:uncharacterized membrane protein affecting hemolysin expression